MKSLSPPRTAAPEKRGRPIAAAIPILSAKHFCRQWQDGPDGTRCLGGWLLTLPLNVMPRMKDALHSRVGPNVATFNDDLKNSRAKLAAVWNAARKGLVTK